MPTTKPNDNVTTSNSLKVGGVDCIDFLIAGKSTATNPTAPAYILFAKNPTNQGSGVCAQVLAAEPLKAYFTSKVDGANIPNDKGGIAIGSSTSVYGK